MDTQPSDAAFRLRPPIEARIRHGEATDAVVGSAWAQAEEARRTAGLTINEAHDPQTIHDVSEVLSSIWQSPEQSIIDASVLTAMAHAGNPVLIAHEQGRVVGAAVGFCGPLGSPFHSHIVGLLPAAVGRGLGLAIKLHQRAWCLERSINRMTWTYDPLVGRNAFFNIARLGARPIEYLPDFYGRMSDSINSGQLSDRMLISWDLRQNSSPAPEDSAISRGVSGPLGEIARIHRSVDDLDGSPSNYQVPESHETLTTVSVPRNIEVMRRTNPHQAHTWRLQTRSALVDLFSSGWEVIGFDRSSRYLLSRSRHTNTVEKEETP